MNVNSTNNVNTVSSTVNVAGTNEDNELPFDRNMPALEDVGTFDFLNEDEDDDAVADMNNLDTSIQVCPTPTTRFIKIILLIKWMSKVLFSMGKLKKSCTYVNHSDLKIQTFLIEYTRLKKHCMDYIKLLEPGMKPCQHICWTMDFKEEKLTRHYSSKGTKVIFC
nr:hypothetical protein [Tanacetum cinerariifolium]